MALRQREELREKLAAAKEKRLLNQKLGKIKTLGEDDPWLDDTAAWIERSRQLQKEKDLAEKRAKLLEEMDQEFGVSTLVEEEFEQRRQDLYSARDLQGLTVEHAIDSFREGETVVLTLKDKGELAGYSICGVCTVQLGRVGTVPSLLCFRSVAGGGGCAGECEHGRQGAGRQECGASEEEARLPAVCRRRECG